MNRTLGSALVGLSLLAAATARADPPPPPAGASGLDPRLAAGIAGIDLGVVSLGIGILSAVQVAGVNNNPTLFAYRMEKGPLVEDVCETAQADHRPDITSLCAKGHTFMALQLVFFPLSILSSGLGAFFLATRPSPPKPTSTRVDVIPTVGRQKTGLDLVILF